jgi:hypothetical protein
MNPQAPRRSDVPRINIYLLRAIYALMFFVLGKNTWSEIIFHHGVWNPSDAVAWCVWTAFATLAGIGIIRPLRMLPILLLEVFYKILWLIIVAYPLWAEGTLWESTAAGTTAAFLWVVLPIAAIPWGYVFTHYFLPPKSARSSRHASAAR